MENKSLKPKIRFKGFTEAWEQRKFGECVLIQRGGSPRPIESYLTTDNINGINWIKIGDVKAGERYITKTAEKIIPEGVKNSREVFPGDLILSNSMSFGRPYIMGVYGCIHDGWLVIKDTNNLFDKEYLLQLLSSEYMYNQYRQLASGGVVNNLNSELVQNTNILLTNMEEQKKLGLIFKSIDNLITLHQRKCDKLVNIKKSLLEKMFPKNGNNVPEIRFKGFTEAWEQRKLLEVANYRNGKAHENDIDENGKYIVVNSKFVSTEGEIKKYSNKQNEPLEQNDIAFVLSDVPNGRAIAKTFLVDKSNKYTLNQRIAGITPHDNINPKYLAITMNRNKYFLQFDDGVKQTNLSLEDMKKYESFYPEKKEQDKLGNTFETIDNLITLHQKKLNKLKNIKKSLLDKMFV